MLDSSNMFHVLSLYDDDYYNDKHSDSNGNHYVNSSQLVTIKSFRQDELLGCNITQYAGYYELYSEGNDTTFVMMYQCSLKQTISLKFATLVVRRSNESNVDPDFDRDVIHSSITNLTGSINMAVPVMGVDVYDFCKNTSTFKMIITISLNTTYQNVLFFYEA